MGLYAWASNYMTNCSSPIEILLMKPRVAYYSYVKPENSSKHNWFLYRTWVKCVMVTPKYKTGDSQNPLYNFTKFILVKNTIGRIIFKGTERCFN